MAGQAALSASPVIQIGQSVERAQHAFRPADGGSVFVAGLGSHQVEVGTSGAFIFRPSHQRAALPGGRASHPVAALVGAPVTLTTAAIGRDHAAATTSGSASLGSDGSIETDRGIATEHLRDSSVGVEQSWSFATRPGGEGDLVLRIALSGESLVAENPTGLHFVDRATGVGLRYGVGTFIDAAGARTEIRPRFVGGQIVLTVPAGLVESSPFPAVLDPTLSAEFGIDTPAAGGSELAAGVASSGTNFLVAWQDSRGGPAVSTVRGRLVSLDGTLLGGDSFVISSAVIGGTGDGGGPTVTWDGDSYLVTFLVNTDTIQGARVNASSGAAGATFNINANGIFKLGYPRSVTTRLGATAGQTLVAWSQVGPVDGSFEVWGVRIARGATTLTGNPFPIEVGDGVNGVFGVGVATDGTNYFVSNIDFAAPAPGVSGRTVSAAGLPTPTVGARLRISNGGSTQNTAVAFDGTNYLVVFDDGRRPGGAGGGNIDDLFGGRVSATGALVDPVGGVPIFASPGTTNSSAPALVFDGTSYVLAFRAGFGPTVVQQLSPAAVPIGAAQTIAGSSSPPFAGTDGAGHSMVVFPGVGAVLFTNLPNGAACTAAGNCASGFCVGGSCCATACSSGSAVTACGGGTCTVVSCIGATSNCDGNPENGCETAWSPLMCGGCGPAFACSTTNVAPTCSAAGVCAGTCLGAFAHCAGDIRTTGCETPIDTLTNCGGCGAACGAATACSTPLCRPSGASFGCLNLTSDHCATPTCGLGACATVDTDGDGLQDTWETQGYVDVNCNGVNDGEGIDVQLPGADPNVPDVYVELDYQEKAGSGTACTNDAAGDSLCNGLVAGEQCVGGVCTHTHRPKQSSLDAVVAAAARGLTAGDPTRPGFRIHFDATHMNSISETVPVVSFGTNADPTIHTLDPSCVGPSAANYFDLKAINFFPGSNAAFYAARKRVYHYGMFTHFSSCPNDAAACLNCTVDRGGGHPQAGASGTSELPGNDFIVSLGARYFGAAPRPRKDIDEGGTLLHELGHNLGLSHGVALNSLAQPAPALQPEYSPTYFSIMNYNYQLTGVLQAGAPGSAVPSTSKIDFSDTTCGVNLAESALNEGAGAQCGGSTNYVVKYFPTTGAARFGSATTGTAVNWNGKNDPVSGLPIDTNPVSVDLNRINGTTETFYSFNDWAYDFGTHKFTNLNFAFGCLPWTLQDGLAPPEALVTNEQTPAQAAAHQASGPPAFNVQVTVRPGCNTHWVAPTAPGNVPVVIFGAPGFDAAKIIPGSVLLAGNAAVSGVLGDVNGDGLADLTVQIPMLGLGLAPGDTAGTVQGSLTDGSDFVASGALTVVASPGPILTPKADANGFSGTLTGPPNGAQVSFSLASCVASATDRCGGSISPLSRGHIVKITSDEEGEGRQAVLTGNATFTLQHRRAGNGDGRVYTVYYTVSDGLGDATAGKCKFEVRHNVRLPAIDSGTEECFGTCP